MNKQELLDKAKKDYEKTIEHIEVAVVFLKPIEEMLPEGWVMTVDPHRIYSIQVRRGRWDSDEKIPIDEFRLVCKLFETAVGNKSIREAHANPGSGEIESIEARCYAHLDSLTLNCQIKIYNPDHKCEIKWATRTYQQAVVDDACLGLHPEAS